MKYRFQVILGNEQVTLSHGMSMPSLESIDSEVPMFHYVKPPQTSEVRIFHTWISSSKSMNKFAGSMVVRTT